MHRLIMRWAGVGSVVVVLITPAALRSVGEPASTPGQQPITEVGVASWYGEECAHNATASGEAFDVNVLTAAHRRLPFGTLIRVTNLKNGKAVNLRVNDRGPWVQGRILDVSRQAAKLLGFIGAGLALIRIEVLNLPSRNSDPLPGREAGSPAADVAAHLRGWPGSEATVSRHQPAPPPFRPE